MVVRHLFNASLIPALAMILAILLLLGATSLHANEVSAALNKNVVTENEIVQLTVRADFSDTGTGPDFSPLKRDFDILSQSQNSQFSFNLGTNKALSFWVVTLKPKAVGNFQIPSIKVGNETSNPLYLEVKPARQMTDTNGNPLVRLEFKTDTLQPYVQQQVKLTLELFSAAPLQNTKLSTPNHPNLLIERLSDDQIRYEDINGTSYQVLTREYIAFPQRSGSVQLNNQTVDAILSTSSGRRAITVKSSTIDLDVLPIPASYGNTNWLPTDALAIKSQLTTSLDTPRVGDTLNWTIDISAHGVLGEQLPTINFDSTRAYKLYPTPPKFDTRKSSAGVTGRESINIEVVPTEAGTLTLPKVEVIYWDPTERAVKSVSAMTNTMEIAALPSIAATEISSAPQTPTPEPSQTIDNNEKTSEPVAPISLKKPNKVTEPSVPSDAEPAKLNVVLETQQSTPIPWVTILAIALIVMGTTGLLILLRRQRQHPRSETDEQVPTLQEFAPLTSQDESSAFNQLLNGCRNNDLSTLRLNLLEWARHRWGSDSIRGVEDIKRLANNPRLTQLLMEAELVMYSDTASTQWNGEALANTLEEYATGQKKPSQASQLKTLYPNF